jgi:transposase
MNKTVSKINVGVDVSKKQLDVHLHPIGKSFQVNNTVSGIEKLKSMLKEYDIDKITFEASGGYEVFMMRELQQSGFNTWRIEGSRASAFARSEGILSKNDKKDAKNLALFGAQKNPKHAMKILSDKEIKLKELVRRRDDIVNMISCEKTRIQQASDDFCKETIQDIITFLEQKLSKIRTEISKEIKSDKILSRRYDIAISMPGIGETTASTLVAELPELGFASKGEISALTGLAPYVRQSGSYKGKAFIARGRTSVRKVVYMAALTASRSNPDFKEFYTKLRAAGKAAKIALIAVARKMIISVNAMFKNDTMWKESMVPKMA